MTEQEHRLPINGFGELFERVTVMYSVDRWSTAFDDLSAVLGTPAFTDGSGWSSWSQLSLSDESGGPAWCLLARTSDLDATIDRATALGWQTGQRSAGGHETRAVLTAPTGLTVIAYTPAPGP